MLHVNGDRHENESPEAFVARLHTLLGGRRQTPWGERLGSNKGTIYRMFQGEIPRWETLCAIQHAENVSLSWLLTGAEPAFLVEHRSTDAGCAEWLQARLGEAGDWTVYLVADSHGVRCLVGTRAAAFDARGRRVEYTAVEVLAGPVGRETLSALDGLAAREAVRVARTAAEDAERIARGEVGTFGLFGDGGLLAEAAANRQALSRLAGGEGPPVASHVPQAAEPSASRDPLCHNAGRLSDAGRTVARATIEALLENEGRLWEEPY